MAAQTFANVGPLGIPSIAPLIRDDLALSVAEAGSFISAYYIGPSLMSLPAGWMADRWGVLPSMVLGQVLIAVGLVAVGGSHAFPLMAACMVVSGAGYGILNPTTTKAGMAWFPPRQRATVVGLKQVGLPLGGALGALTMPPLALAFGWRTAVVLPAALVAVLALVTWLLYREPPTAPQGGTSVAPLSLRMILHLSLVDAGHYLVMAQVTGMVGRVIFGMLSDRLFGGRRRIVLVIAGIGSTVCSLVMAGTGPGTGWWVLAPLALAFGFFGIGWNGVQHTLLAELVGPRDTGTAVGLGLAISSFGVTICPPLFGLAVQHLGSFRIPWIGLGVVMALNMCLLIPVRERRRETW